MKRMERTKRLLVFFWVGVLMVGLVLYLMKDEEEKEKKKEEKKG